MTTRPTKTISTSPLASGVCKLENAPPQEIAISSPLCPLQKRFRSVTEHNIILSRPCFTVHLRISSAQLEDSKLAVVSFVSGAVGTTEWHLHFPRGSQSPSDPNETLHFDHHLHPSTTANIVYTCPSWRNLCVLRFLARPSRSQAGTMPAPAAQEALMIDV